MFEASGETTAGFIDSACAAPGCIEARTARKPIATLRAAVDANLLALAVLSTSIPAPTETPVAHPGMNHFRLCIPIA